MCEASKFYKTLGLENEALGAVSGIITTKEVVWDSFPFSLSIWQIFFIKEKQGMPLENPTYSISTFIIPYGIVGGRLQIVPWSSFFPRLWNCLNIHFKRYFVFVWIYLKNRFLVAQMVKCLPAMWETQVRSLGREDLLEKEMATHSSTVAWKTPWPEELGGL